MNAPFLVAGMLLGTFFSPVRDPMVRFLCKQIEILLRVLADHGVSRVICTPDERIALMAIGKELDHQVSDIFLINTWQTYRKWRREERNGKKPGRPGRPPKFSAETVRIVLRVARENLTFGLLRIQGEMKKLGIPMSLGSIKTILRRNGVTPPEDRVYSVTGTWQKFVANVDSLVACDFLTKPVYSLFGKADAYVLIFIHLGSRRVWMSPATFSPNDAWCRKQAIQACMWIEDEGIPFRHLIRDNDSKFTDRFDSIFNDLSDADKPVVRTGIRMPVMNSFAEAFIGRFKIECLNHFLCFSLDHLDHIVGQFQNYHNNFRPHQGGGIGNRVLDPDWEPPPEVGNVRCRELLGGLLRHYYREAA